MADVTTRDGFIYLLPSPSGGEVLGLASLKDGVLELFLGPVGKQVKNEEDCMGARRSNLAIVPVFKTSKGKPWLSH